MLALMLSPVFKGIPVPVLVLDAPVKSIRASVLALDATCSKEHQSISIGSEKWPRLEI